MASADLRKWALRSPDLAELRRQSVAADEAEAKRLHERAKLLGLPWPLASTKRAGRPSYKSLYQEALVRAVRGHGDLTGISPTMPRSWQPGQSLLLSVDSALKEAAHLAQGAEGKEDA